MPKNLLEQLYQRSAEDWDERVAAHPLVWMSNQTDPAKFWESGSRDFDLLFAHTSLQVLPEHTALEFGCGVGRLLRKASSVFSKTIGVDVSARALTIARENLGDNSSIELHHAPTPHLSAIATGSIDVCYSYGVMGILSPIVFLQALSELSRALRLDGQMLFQFYLGTEQLSTPEDSLAIRCYERKRFLSVVKQLGLHAISCDEFLHPDGDVSQASEGLIASIAVLKKTSETPVFQESLLELLCEKPERPPTSTWPGSKLEYQLAITRAEQFITQGRLKEAREVFKFALSRFQGADPDIEKIIKAIDENIERDD